MEQCDEYAEEECHEGIKVAQVDAGIQPHAVVFLVGHRRRAHGAVPGGESLLVISDTRCRRCTVDCIEIWWAFYFCDSVPG